jgi:hypothetical protein
MSVSFPKSSRKSLLTNEDKYCLIKSFAVLVGSDRAALIFSKTTITHDKGKPVARQGRKAVSLLNTRMPVFHQGILRDCLVAEGGRRKPKLQKLCTVARAIGISGSLLRRRAAMLMRSAAPPDSV